MGRPPRISRDQILAAARAVFTNRGFDGATLADIAAPLGVTPAAILRHFDSKQALFTAAMSGTEIGVPPPVEELAHADASDDPRVVLRRFAEQIVPFISRIIRPSIAVQMHMAARQTTVVVPFDTGSDENPSRRGLRIVTDYFRRCMEAGTLRPGDPRALALIFVGHLQSYVFIHQVLTVTPVYPLDRYLDALFDLWSDGAFVKGGTRARKKNTAQTTDRRDRGPGDRDGDARVRARAEKTEAARPGRNARGADGERRVARRRPRDPRARR